MRWFSENVIDRLLGRHAPPCLSLYMPTHREHPGALHDRTLFRSLVNDAELTLRESYTKRQTDALLANVRAYADEAEPWPRQLDGLAAFVCPHSFNLIQLQRPVWPMAVVGEAFHVKPLIRVVQSLDRYHVLGVSGGGAVTLYEGNPYALDAVELEGVPQGLMTGACGTPVARLLVAASDPADQRLDLNVGGVAGDAARHGASDGADEEEEDVVRFLRAVDRAVWRHHSRPAGLPLMLAAPAEYHPIFRQVSHNLNLLPDGVVCDPGRTEPNLLQDRAWRAFEHHYHARVARNAQRFHMARRRDAASADLTELARAAVCGHVETLLIQSDRHVGGRIDPSSGTVTWNDSPDPRAHDLLDDLAEHVLRTDGDVFVIPPERMPVTTGAAGVFR